MSLKRDAVMVVERLMAEIIDRAARDYPSEQPLPVANKHAATVRQRGISRGKALRPWLP